MPLRGAPSPRNRMVRDMNAVGKPAPNTGKGSDIHAQELHCSLRCYQKQTLTTLSRNGKVPFDSDVHYKLKHDEDTTRRDGMSVCM